MNNDDPEARRQFYLLPAEVAERLMLPLEDVIDRIATGELPSIIFPTIGIVIPRAVLPPFERPHEV